MNNQYAAVKLITAQKKKKSPFTLEFKLAKRGGLNKHCQISQNLFKIWNRKKNPVVWKLNEIKIVLKTVTTLVIKIWYKIIKRNNANFIDSVLISVCKGGTYTKTKHCIIFYYKQFSSLQI